MRKIVIFIMVAVLAVAGGLLYKRNSAPATEAAGLSPAGGGGGGRTGGRAGRGGPRGPMPVEFATVSRGALSDHVLVVGNLIGAATVEVAPRVNGRLQAVNVKLGDTVRRGQVLARVEDEEIQQQVRQAEASYQVAQATIRQREADLKLAKTNLDRSKSLVDRELLPQQTYDDTEARHQAAIAQLDLARAQFEQSKARLDELKITLANTNIVSPVDGFVSRRYLDPGSSVGANSPVAAVVDIRTVRLVANLVERDVKQVRAGTPAIMEVDAYPGEKFSGTVSRVAPVFDPSTRTAEMEIEVPNPGFRLKPGMYARVELTVETRGEALTVPRNSLVDYEGRSGVFIAEPAPAGRAAGPAAGESGQGRRGEGAPAEGAEAVARTAAPGAPANSGGRQAGAAGPGGGGTPGLVARFLPVETGIRTIERVEILGGIPEGARVITVGAGALRDGDPILLATGERGRGEGQPEARPERTR
ncbi:MAG: efflux RND transporter periplasmic adaptor subunit [Acidobacteria bacterium]|nr:efflux RND transporter periplasmic adaptor subunit [Acidobacteriota bacterium]